MENPQNYYQTPRYIEVNPNGEILRQAPTVPPEVVSNYLSARENASYSPTHSTFSSTPSQNYSYYSTANGKQWWQPTGAAAYNPYRTTYQDYGNAKKQTAVYHTPTTHFMTRPGQYS